jgi:hypothetical protein
MASFSFNFLSEQQFESDDAAASATGFVSADDNKTPNDTTATTTKEPKLPFHWINENVLEKLFIERSQEEIVYTEIGLPAEDGLDVPQPLRCVDLSLSSFHLKSNETMMVVADAAATTTTGDNDTTTATTDEKDCHENDRIPEQSLPVWHSTDIQPGVYEGGRKIWEASLDMVQFLASSVHDEVKLKEGDFVLELGCGHGLPLIYLLLRQALITQNEKIHRNNFITAVFTDYNDSVLLDATLSNIVLNCPSCCCCTSPLDTEFSITDNHVRQHIVLGAGDWLDMSDQLQQLQQHDDHNHHCKDNDQCNHATTKLPRDGKFDLILAAETIYSERAARETSILLKRHLKSSTGIAYVATKRYYFGVGGGVDAFRQYGQTNDLDIETVRVHDDGSSNIREILRVKLKQSSL